MSKITENIEELRKILNEEPFDKTVAFEFLEAILEGVDDLETDVIDFKDEKKMLENEITSKDSYISELERNDTIIECGIGTINYEVDNLALGDIMENLGIAIQKTNFSKVREVLASI